LNILDADYYFKLLDCMLKQDLAGALLLYDDINRKGFEGDLVVNGFAEFTRNLLVCKDEKAAALLEVVESFRDKYTATGKNVSAAILISTLNILNETEINYKSCTYKRLACRIGDYQTLLSAAGVRTSSEGNGVSKKKLIDAARPVAFRQIVALEVKSEKLKVKSTESSKVKLIIESVTDNYVNENKLAEETPSYEKRSAISDQQPETQNPKRRNKQNLRIR